MHCSPFDSEKRFRWQVWLSQVVKLSASSTWWREFPRNSCLNKREFHLSHRTGYLVNSLMIWWSRSLGRNDSDWLPFPCAHMLGIFVEVTVDMLTCVDMCRYIIHMYYIHVYSYIYIYIWQWMYIYIYTNNYMHRNMYIYIYTTRYYLGPSWMIRSRSHQMLEELAHVSPKPWQPWPIGTSS